LNVCRGVAVRLAVCVACLGALAPASSSARSRLVRLDEHIFTFVDTSRMIRLPDGRRVPRKLTTVVRYPSSGGPYPLIVFGHGFALTPATYAGLLRSWATAGYVVAAPAFPLENANAPGGPDESDLVNEPADMRVVITRLIRLTRRVGGVLGGKIDPARIAVAGHSDGAEAALAVAYGARYRDPRIRAAIILSGATLPGMGTFPRHGPALLAAQGTADPINLPQNTGSYFRLAPRPKFLLWLRGASHLPPFTDEEPQLRIVEEATVAFLDHYLEGKPLAALSLAARHPGLTDLVSAP
jgi:predicted dienelactone hydrolase